MVRLASAEGQSISLSGTPRVDGILTAPGDRILVWQQNEQTQNGIYFVVGFDANGVGIPMLRAADADRSGQFETGKRVRVADISVDPSVAGASNVGKVFEYIGDGDPDLDKSPEIVSFADVKYVSEDGENLDLTDRTRARDQWIDVDVVLESTVDFQNPDGSTSTLNLVDLIRNNDETQWAGQTVVVATSGSEEFDDGLGRGIVSGVDLSDGATAIGVEIDGYTVSEDDIVLIKDQADASQNGVWVATIDGWSRFGGENAYQQFETNKVFRVEAGVGDTNSGTFWTYTGATLTSIEELWSNVDGADNTSAVDLDFEVFVNEPDDDVYAYGAAPLQLVDGNGVNITPSMRVLITGLTANWDEQGVSGRDNGIYVVSANGPWTRAADADEASEYRKYQYAKVGTDRFFQFSSDTPTDMAGAKVFQELLFEVGGAGIVGDTAVDFTGETLNGLGEADLDAESRILLKDQTSANENGIYVTSNGPWKRADDASLSGQFIQGKRVGTTDDVAANDGLLFSLSFTTSIRCRYIKPDIYSTRTRRHCIQC